jgi:hypothetical protein
MRVLIAPYPYKLLVSLVFLMAVKCEVVLHCGWVFVLFCLFILLLFHCVLFALVFKMRSLYVSKACFKLIIFPLYLLSGGIKEMCHYALCGHFFDDLWDICTPSLEKCLFTPITIFKLVSLFYFY